MARAPSSQRQTWRLSGSADNGADAGARLVGIAGEDFGIRTILPIMASPLALGQDFLATLGRPFFGEELFDRVDDTVFFLKDREARYVAVNEALARRCKLAGKADLIGRTAREVFPAPLGALYDDQDRRVLSEGLSIAGRLELHIYPNGGQGWCLTWKEPLFDPRRTIVGLSGISRDVPDLAGPRRDAASLSAVLAYVDAHLDASLRIPDLAARAGLSAYQFDQRIRALFGLSVGQYLTRARIERACGELRRSTTPIGIVAQECGYADQAAFTRQFRKSVGLTPKAYRAVSASRAG
jgi:AraC-like DNA-binding protein